MSLSSGFRRSMRSALGLVVVFAQLFVVPHAAARELAEDVLPGEANPEFPELEQKPIEGSLIDVRVIPGERSPIKSLPAAIREPGSYYLAGDLVAPGWGNGIVISADDVTIDLNGFALVGSKTSATGILVDPADPRVNIRVHNGTVRGWGADGIALHAADLVVVEDVRAYQNAGSGIRVGVASQVRRCMVSQNGHSGVRVRSGSTVSETTATRNEWGFYCEVGTATFSGCTALENQQGGFLATEGAVVSGCTALQNGSYGIQSSGASLVSSSLVRDNGTIGIRAGDASAVLDSVAVGNGAQGIVAAADVRVAGSVAVSNASDGIQVAAGGTTVESCTANRNGRYGILLGNGSDDKGCVARGCTVAENALTIELDVRATRSRVEGNHLYGGQLSAWLYVNGSHTRNVVIGNSTIVEDDLTDGFSYLNKTCGKFFNFDRDKGTWPLDIESVGPWANFFSNPH